MKRSDPSYKGQSGYNPALLAIYDVWVLKFMARAVWKGSVPAGITHYRRHLGHRHLDVGPGTGYFIEHAAPPTQTEITLLDPNPHVLKHASKRLAAWGPVVVEADVMKPPARRGRVRLGGPQLRAALPARADVEQGDGHPEHRRRPDSRRGLVRWNGPRNRGAAYAPRTRVPLGLQQGGRLRQPR
jgi:hypothetical protein